MSDNKKDKDFKYYESLNLKDMEDFPIDTYIGSKKEAKNVGKIDEYNKPQKVNNNTNNKASIDDLIPNEIGNAIDGVFSTVDSFLTATSTLFFGKKQIKQAVKRPQVKQIQKPQTQEAKPVQVQQIQAVKKQSIQQQSQVKQVSKSQVVKQVQSAQYQQQSIEQAKIKHELKVQHEQIIQQYKKEEEKHEDKITRTTAISDLDIPFEFLNDPDLVRYFEQMKLYEKKVKGGLCSLTYKQASDKLKKGKWGKSFTIEYEKLNVSTMLGNPEEGRIRFNGMIPVYKALAKQFADTAQLKKAIEDDINTYLKTGEGISEFHKFTYKISRKTK